jgi:hypothetical protein
VGTDVWRRFGLLAGRALGVTVGSALALWFAWQAFVVGVNHGPGPFLRLGAGGVLTFFGLLAAHELGHLLAGRAVGLPFRGLAVGPLRVARDGDGLRAHLNTDWFGPPAYFTHGPAAGADARRRAVMLLGGPLASLIPGAACLVAGSWLNPGPPADLPGAARSGWRGVALLYPGDAWTAALNTAGVLSLGLGLGTLVPGRAAGCRTDGGPLLDLWRAEADAYQERCSGPRPCQRLARVDG